MADRYVLHATCDVLHLGIRRGDTVVWHPTGQAFVTRPLKATAGALAGLVADGVLTTPSPADAPLVAEQLRRSG